MNTHGTASPHPDEDAFQRFLQNARGSMAVIQDGRIRFCTPCMAKLTGYDQEELLASDIGIIVHPDHRDRMLSYYAAPPTGEMASLPMEFKGVAKSGPVLWLQRTGVMIQWGGEPALLDMFSDITSRKQKEDELGRNQERFLLAMEIANEGLWDWNVKTGEVHLNSVWYSILGYEPEDFHNEKASWQALVHPDDLPGAKEAINQHMHSSTPFDLIFRMRARSGEYRWINSKGRVVEKDRSGRALRMVGTHQDVTEHIRTQKALEESEQRFKTLHDSSSSGIFIHDKGTLVDCNKRLSEITGYAAHELMGMDGLLLVSESSREEVMQKISVGFEKPYEVTGRRNNGEEYPLLVEARNIPFRGKMLRVVEFRDLTESRQAKKKQAVLKARLDALWQVSRMVEADYDTLCDLMLREAQTMTASEFSFFGYIDPDNTTLTLQAWSPDVKEECRVEGGTLSLPIHGSSIWARAVNGQRRVIINDYEAAKEHTRGLPRGHVPISRVLLVPILQSGTVTALAAVANKSSNYTEDDASQVTAFVTNVMLLLERRTIEEELKESEKKLFMALEMALMGQWELDLASMTFTFNEQFYLIYGTSSEREGGLSMSAEAYAANFVHPDEVDIVTTEIARILGGEYDATRAQLEHRIVRRDGEVRYIQVRFAVVNDGTGQPEKAIGVNQDITQRKQTEEAIASQRRRLADIIQGTNVGTWEWNVQTGETVFNERWADIIGHSLEEISPTSIDTWVEFVHPDDLELSGELLEKHFRGELEYYECEARMKHSNGDWVWVLDRGKVSTWTEDGKPLLMSGTHQDITEKKRIEERIRHLATHDVLTDLPSLRLAKDRIRLALSVAKRKDMLSAVLFIDLDGFKNVNDRLGHDAGDALLKEIAKRLSQCVREVDTVARIGGDEFMVVLSELKAREDAGLVAGKIVNTVRTPLAYKSDEMRVSASVGIAVFDKDCGGMEIERFIKQADRAMYHVKRTHKDGYAYADDLRP